MVHVIKECACFKAAVVSKDERENGLRGLLNFGHSIGHAIESKLTPYILHGECVSIGMILEMELARHLGYCTTADIGRMSQLLAVYCLPTSLEDPLILSKIPSSLRSHCSANDLMNVMRIDKKNTGNKKNIVLLQAIGKTVGSKAHPVPDEAIRLILSPAVIVKAPVAKGKFYELNVPGSKSISNRALLLAALGRGKCRLTGLLVSDDVQVSPRQL